MVRFELQKGNDLVTYSQVIADLAGSYFSSETHISIE